MNCEYCNNAAPPEIPQLVELKGKMACVFCAAQMPSELLAALRSKVDPLKRKLRNRRKRKARALRGK